jgi:hypothetical protein
MRSPEESEAYGSNFTGKNEALSTKNARFWNENPELTVPSLVPTKPRSNQQLVGLYNSGIAGLPAAS